MRDINELLDKTFGQSDSNRAPSQINNEKKKRIGKAYKKSRGMYLSIAEITELKIALNYAINSIKNKSDVKYKKENTTYYHYYYSWNKIREKIKEKLEK